MNGRLISETTYSCPTSRHDFTQVQLFALLALKTFLKTDYRGVVAFLEDFPSCARISA